MPSRLPRNSPPETSAPPGVSVVMPCFNAARHLEASVASVLGQTVGDWELIAIDDGSTDDTLGRLSAIQDRRVRILSQSNQGVSAARNAGIAASRGRFLAFLDADDTWGPGFLAEMVAALDNHPGARLAYCGWQNLGLPSDQGEPFIPPDYENSDKPARLLQRCRWPIHAALTYRTEVERAGGFDGRLAVGEDFLLWMVIAIPHTIVRVPKVLAYYHFHGDAQASRDRLRFARQTLAAQRAYLSRNPGLSRQLGRRQIRALTLGELRERAYQAYWTRDLATARALFTDVMKSGYVRLSDWRHMLPCLLPESLHRALIRIADAQSRT